MIEQAGQGSPSLPAGSPAKAIPLSVTVRLVAAQIFGIVGLLLSLLVTVFTSTMISSNLYQVFGFNGVDTAILAIYSTLFGMIVGSFEWLALRRWAARWWVWTVVCIITFMVILSQGTALLDRVSLAAPGNLSRLDPSVAPLIERELYRVNMLAGAVVGIPCGLFCGLVQSLLLRFGRRRWWLLSLITWALVFCALGAFNAFNSIFLSGSFI